MSLILSNKSDEEIKWMLEDYGIKHGPVVGTTRPIYEKKLREAIANEKKARRKSRPPPDRSFYREEEEEITYEHRRPQFRDEPFRKSQWQYREMDAVDDYRMRASYSNMTQSEPAASRWGTEPPAPEVKKSSRWIPVWVQFLVFVLVAVVLFFVFLNMEPAENVPLKKLN